MKKVLLPVDGSKSSDNAVKHVIDLARSGLNIEIHVLNVQMPIQSGEIHRFIPKENIEGYYREEGEKALQSARALLTQANLPYIATMQTGPVAETIAAYVKKHGRDAVIMGTRGMTSLGTLLMGSTATKIIHVLDVPVTLVK
jgi:nucleotide-binding universal stress UspA family protein